MEMHFYFCTRLLKLVLCTWSWKEIVVRMLGLDLAREPGYMVDHKHVLQALSPQFDVSHILCSLVINSLKG